MALQIKQIPIEEINPATYNPRAISEESLQGLKASLTRFGMVDPLVVNTKTGNLVGGHQRFRAACELGWKKVAVVHVNISLVEEKALNVTLNNQRISGFFTDGLQDLLKEIKVDFDPGEFADLKLDDLVLGDVWDDGKEEVDDTEENLDGIVHTFKVKCPQEIKDEVLITLKRAILETSLEGVEIV